MRYRVMVLVLAVLILAAVGCSRRDKNPTKPVQVVCPGEVIGNTKQPPVITINPPAAGASTLSGTASNIDARKTRVVLWALTNMWYVQPWIDSPYTSICSDGMWSNSTHPWDRIMALLVDQTYVPGATRTSDPSLDPGVLASAQYPPARTDLPLKFSGYTWDIKVAMSPFDPGPNYWSDSPQNVWVDAQGMLHLQITYSGNRWWCSEVVLPRSLGYGVYTIQIASRLDNLDLQSVAGIFTYESGTRELDHEFAGDALIPGANNAQNVVQPYTRAGNINRYIMPNNAQSTLRLVWRADHIDFITWQGWAFPPSQSDLVSTWTYTGPDIPPPGGERFHFNLWLFGGQAPQSNQGDQLIIKSFTFQP